MWYVTILFFCVMADLNYIKWKKNNILFLVLEFPASAPFL